MVSRDKRVKKESGIALILVLWTIVMLGAIVGEFAYSMRTELNITRNFKEEEEAYQLALAGIEHAKLEILSTEEPQYPYINKDGILIFKKGDENPERKGSFKNSTFSYLIINEDGKLNINTALLEQMRYLIENSELELETKEVDTIVDSIIDWRDTDNLHMLNGAEEDYYQSLPRPYSSKDGQFDIIEELLLVKGVTPEIFHSISQYLSAKNSNKININTAPKVVLETVFGISVAENIIKQREIGPILNPIGNSTVNSTFFTIVSTGANIDGTIKRSIKTILQREEDKLNTIYWNDNWIEGRA